MVDRRAGSNLAGTTAAFYEAGTTLLRLGRPEEAARWLASVLLLDPKHQPAKKALADCLRALGDPKRAGPGRGVVAKG